MGRACNSHGWDETCIVHFSLLKGRYHFGDLDIDGNIAIFKASAHWCVPVLLLYELIFPSLWRSSPDLFYFLRFVIFTEVGCEGKDKIQLPQDGGLVASSCEGGNEPPGSINSKNLLTNWATISVSMESVRSRWLIKFSNFKLFLM
jgi:hypothetical protein